MIQFPKTNTPTKLPHPLVRPLRAVATGGQSDQHLLAGRAADEIERLSSYVHDLETEIARYANPLSDMLVECPKTDL